MTITGSGRFVVGTRGSALARWQTDHVTDAVTKAHLTARVKLHVEVKVITTQGDVSLAQRLVGQIEKGFFTAELEAALRDGAIDWAVHSLKDLPTRIPEDLEIAAVLPRFRPHDLLLVREEAFEDRGPLRLPVRDGVKIGTSSLRRDAQLKTFAQGCDSQPLRGNVPTRLQKLRDGQYGAIVLAGAGVLRLGIDLTGLHVLELDARTWQPAPGQGAIAVETRKGHGEVLKLMSAIDDAPSRASADLERRFLKVLEGGCSTPFGAHVELADGGLGHAWLGRAGTDGLWRSTACVIPRDVDDGFIERTLQTLSERSKSFSLETPHVHSPRLWRPL